MNAPHFRYTDNKKDLYSIEVDTGQYVEVVGDPDNASYEWIIRSQECVTEYSDDGYGMPEVALRDGLIAYLGMPLINA